MQLGLIGLGKMGGNMRERLRRAGHTVVGFDTNQEISDATDQADMVAQLLCDGKTPADLPFQTFDNGIATINTETCEALGLDLNTVKEAFKPYCTEVVEVTTAEDF